MLHLKDFVNLKILNLKFPYYYSKVIYAKILILLFAVPEKPSIMKQPWFIGMLIGTIGGTLWIALCIVSIWLCRKKHTQKKLMEQSGMYSSKCLILLWHTVCSSFDKK